eukprot:9380741-Alexandrium_andersonii.AAC.1
MAPHWNQAPALRPEGCYHSGSGLRGLRGLADWRVGACELAISRPRTPQSPLPLADSESART